MFRGGTSLGESMKLLALGLALLVSSFAFAADEVPHAGLLDRSEPSTSILTALHSTETVEVAERCCKHCSAGKACGDSCISRDKQCHKGPGCACD